MKVIFHTVGASLFTNYVRNNLSEQAKTYNALLNKREEDLNPSEKSQIDHIIANLNQILLTQNETELGRASAETNSIIKYWQYCKDKNKMPNHVIHYLLVTDTYIGKEIGTTLKNAFEKNDKLGLTLSEVEVRVINDLNTDSIANFQKGLSNLTMEVLDLIKYYGGERESFTFNLSGGFKGVLAYLNTIANLYAEESIYIFENGKDLLVIPSFPVEKLNPENMDVIQNNFDALRKLNNGSRVNPSQLDKLDNFYVEQNGKNIDFTPYGLMVFDQYKSVAYQKQIFSPTSKRIKFGKKFIASCAQLHANEYCLLNEQLDLLSRYCETGNNPNKLDYKKLKSKNTKDGIAVTFEFDAFGGSDSRRCYCNQDNDTITVEILDTHL